MKKAQFIKKVLKEKPELSNVDTFFYVSPVEHILSGFCCEITPHGAYINRFLYPLFDKNEFIHLTYSQRLKYPDGYIDFDKVDKKELANEFLSRINGYVDSAYDYLTIQQFCHCLDERPELLDHEHAQMIFGYAMVLLNEKDKAREYLNKAIAELRKPFYDECNQILTLLDEDLESAKQVILSWEAEMKESIGLRKEK